jgi:hypothetical protein
MSQPIGEYCLSLEPSHFEPERPYPDRYQHGARRKRSIDFSIFRRSQNNTQNVLAHAIESKFVNSNRPFTQEVYDDLYRLLWFQPTREPERCQRWLLVAGYHKNIVGNNFLDSTAQVGRGRGKRKVHAFRGLLSTDLHNTLRLKPIHQAVPELRKLWVDAADAFGQTLLPDEIAVRLAARYPSSPRPADLSCFIWEIIRPQPDFVAAYPCIQQ